jgi:hypothetical protein
VSTGPITREAVRCKGADSVRAADQAECMSTPTPDTDQTPEATTGVQPLRDNDTSIEPDPTVDPAQAEWDRTTALDEGADPEDLDPVTNTGADPAEIPDDADEIPATDLHPDAAQPDTQGDEPLEAELGEDGQGDLAPEDL